jgi:hypothetical protein
VCEIKNKKSDRLGDTVRALPGRLSGRLAFSYEKLFCTRLLYGRAGRLTALFGGFRLPARAGVPDEELTAARRGFAPRALTSFTLDSGTDDFNTRAPAYLFGPARRVLQSLAPLADALE